MEVKELVDALNAKLKEARSTTDTECNDIFTFEAFYGKKKIDNLTKEAHHYGYIILFFGNNECRYPVIRIHDEAPLDEISAKEFKKRLNNAFLKIVISWLWFGKEPISAADFVLGKFKGYDSPLNN